MSLVETLLRAPGSYIGRGILHSIGGDPTRIARNGVMEMNLYGRRLHLHPGNPVPESVGGGMPTSFLGTVMGAAGVMSLAASGVMGYMEGGFLGAGAGIMRDIGVDAALVRFGYSHKERDGITYLTAGRIPPGRAMPRLGRFNRYLDSGIASAIGGAGRFTDFMGRAVMGHAVASAAAGLVGGGVGSTPIAFLGGALGVKYAGRLALAGSAYYMGKTVARGTYSLFKAGYSHQQARKQIQTDGDMSSFMTMGAHTMRERAVQAIQKSHMNARTALGNEATYMSTPSRSYFSSYRQFY